jgi:glycerol-3-phosphate dehydrogenase (NAD(P)+)
MTATSMRIGVIGAGAWGLALAIAATRAGRDVRVCGRAGQPFDELKLSRRSPRLPGVDLPAEIALVDDLADLDGCDAFIVATPAQTIRDACARIAASTSAPRSLIVCAKGIERANGQFMSEVVAESAPGFLYAVLSGPSFAADVARGMPTAVTLASEDASAAADLADALQGPNFRLYDSDDPRGVEIGGAAKNVLAIACGAAAGLGLGASASAALAARGFAELARFGEAYGAKPATLMGLSGLGDLVLTCASPQSRNFAFGFELGRGQAPADAGGGKLAEGAFTAEALVKLARARCVEMPIAEAVDTVIRGDVTAAKAVEILLSRPRRREN